MFQNLKEAIAFSKSFFILLAIWIRLFSFVSNSNNLWYFLAWYLISSIQIWEVWRSIFLTYLSACFYEVIKLLSLLIHIKIVLECGTWQMDWRWGSFYCKIIQMEPFIKKNVFFKWHTREFTWIKIDVSALSLCIFVEKLKLVLVKTKKLVMGCVSSQNNFWSEWENSNSGYCNILMSNEGQN